MCGTNSAKEPQAQMRHGGRFGERFHFGLGHAQRFLENHNISSPDGRVMRVAVKLESVLSKATRRMITRPVDFTLANILHLRQDYYDQEWSLFNRHPSPREHQELHCPNSHLFDQSYTQGHLQRLKSVFVELETYLNESHHSLDCYPKVCLLYISEHCKAIGLEKCNSPECISQHRFLEQHMPRLELVSSPSPSPSPWRAYRDWIATLLACHDSYKKRSRVSTVETDAGLVWALPEYPTELVYPLFYRKGKALKSQPGMTLFGVKKFEHRAPSSSMCMNVPDVVLLYHWARRFLAARNTFRDLSNFPPIPAPCSMFLQLHAVKDTTDIKSQGICPNRVWSLVSVTFHDAGTVALYVGDIVRLATDLARKRNVPDESHRQCSEEFCVLSDENNTSIEQAHKCVGRTCQDATTKFDATEIDRAMQDDPEAVHRTVWSLPGERTGSVLTTDPHILDTHLDYIAISHVWSDGTGGGNKGKGIVNTCLAQYFQRIARKLCCSGIWWDTISVPQDRELRQLAISRMHEYYENAKYIVVHDAGLLTTPWSDDGLPLIALTLSGWFTRAWTGVELFASRQSTQNVKVLFQDPQARSGDPIIKDLDDDILAFVSRPHQQNSPLPQLGHYLAADMIKSCREGGYTRRRRGGGGERSPGHHTHSPGNDERRVRCIQDYRMVQTARKTSWVKDRMEIAGLLCLPSQAFKDLMARQGPLKGAHHITQEILKHFKDVDLADLVHTAAPVESNGHWSWCPPLLYDLGKTRLAMSGDACSCEISSDPRFTGSFTGEFQAVTIPSFDVIEPLNPLASSATLSRVGVGQFLASECLLLTNVKPSPPPAGQAFMMVEPVKIGEDDGRRLQCRFLGWVKIKTAVTIRFKKQKRLYSSFRKEKCNWHRVHCRIGYWEKPQPTSAKDWLKLAHAEPLRATKLPGADVFDLRTARKFYWYRNWYEFLIACGLTSFIGCAI